VAEGLTGVLAFGAACREAGTSTLDPTVVAETSVPRLHSVMAPMTTVSEPLPRRFCLVMGKTLDTGPLPKSVGIVANRQ
jgi:hypothetical protein